MLVWIWLLEKSHLVFAWMEVVKCQWIQPHAKKYHEEHICYEESSLRKSHIYSVDSQHIFHTRHLEIRFYRSWLNLCALNMDALSFSVDNVVTVGNIME